MREKMNEDIRQGIHLLFGLLLVGILVFFGREKLLIFTLFSLIVAVILNLSTIIGFRNKELHKTLSVAQRKTEKKSPFVGAMIFLVGVTILTIFFQERQILGGLIVLAVGDSFSTIIGKKFGKTKITDRHTFEGTIAGIGASFIGLLFLF